jgi:membrane protein implicated in regulation of membrane protease activity
MISGGLLVIMLLLSLLSGLDLDIDFGDGDDGGGILKPTLVFFSIGAYIVRGFLMAESNPILALIAGVISGGIAVFVLSIALKWILTQQENVNWSKKDALYKNGKTYLKIPTDGSGLIHIDINGVTREFKAKTNDNDEIPTGTEIQVEKIDGEVVIVTAILN